jgi:histone deacetylase 11
MGVSGLGFIHPFDLERASRAWKIVERELGETARILSYSWEDQPLTPAELLEVHTADYVARMRSPANLAKVLEIPIAWIPQIILDRLLTNGILVAARGTIVATRAALESGLAINFSGGFHHARADAGEGYCLVADAALAVMRMRAEDLLGPDDLVAYVDADAHLGNGLGHIFEFDQRFKIYDQYNYEQYPCVADPLYGYEEFGDVLAKERVDVAVPLMNNTGDLAYLQNLRTLLPSFLDRIAEQGKIGLAIYNAGTDVLVNDPQGNLSVTEDGVLERDMFVLQELRTRGIATVLLPSGGYTNASHRVLARTAIEAAKKFG